MYFSFWGETQFASEKKKGSIKAVDGNNNNNNYVKKNKKGGRGGRRRTNVCVDSDAFIDLFSFCLWWRDLSSQIFFCLSNFRKVKYSEYFFGRVNVRRCQRLGNAARQNKTASENSRIWYSNTFPKICAPPPPKKIHKINTFLNL